MERFLPAGSVRAVLVWIGYEIFVNARANLENQRIASGFGFLNNTAGFDVSQSLIPYSGSDTYTRVFLVGLVNTILVAVIGIFFATLIGFIVALGRLSPNWLMSRVAGGYVELIRNLPVLFQMLFWYLAVLAALPGPRQSISLFGVSYLNNRGLIIPRPIGEGGLDAFLIAILVAIVAWVILHYYARRQLFQHGKAMRIWPYVLGLLIGLPLLATLIFGAPFKVEMPELKGFNFAGGIARHSRIRRARRRALDLHRSFHRRDRPRRHPVGAQGADGGGAVAGA